LQVALGPLGLRAVEHDLVGADDGDGRRRRIRCAGDGGQHGRGEQAEQGGAAGKETGSAWETKSHAWILPGSNAVASGVAR
jgi:hypothetical protein